MIASLLLAFTLETASETLWEESPKGLSGIALVADGRYVAVCDRGGKAYEFSARLEEDELADFSIVREMAFEGFSDADFEGCAIDPLDRTKLWVSDEKTTSIFSFSLKTLKRTDKIALLPVYAGVRFNRSLESLSISPDGLEMWTANEDSLEQDGPSASRKNGGVVRLQRLDLVLLHLRELAGIGGIDGDQTVQYCLLQSAVQDTVNILHGFRRQI